MSSALRRQEDGDQESTLRSFRRAIASHLSTVFERPVEELLPLVQQNTGHRRPTHSVFSVVIKRLTSDGGDLDTSTRQRCLDLSTAAAAETREYIVRARETKDMLLFDPVPLRLIQSAVRRVGARKAAREQRQDSTRTVLGKRDRTADETVIVVDGQSVAQAEESPFCALRRAVLLGFTARVLQGSFGNPAKVITAESSAGEGETNSTVKGLYRGLDLHHIDHSIMATDKHLVAIKSAINSTLINASVQDGFWVSENGDEGAKSHRKLFAVSEDGGFGEPTVLTRTAVLLARYSEDQEEGRCIWLTPDRQRAVVDQALDLAKVVFLNVNSDSNNNGNDSSSSITINSTHNSSQSGRSKDRIRRIEVLYYGPTTGPDLWKDDTHLDRSAVGIMEYTTLRMREVVAKNRGGAERTTGLDDDGDDVEGEEDGTGLVLDEAELGRMSRILTESALAVASVRCKRIRKLNVDMTRILDGKGNSGVFLQYVHARLCGIERKSKARLSLDANLSLVCQYPEALNLCIVIAEWDDILAALQATLDPFVLVPYLFHLATEIGQANHILRVKGMESAVAEARWLLFWAAKQVLEEGLQLLGVEFVEHM
ncbi:Arginyl-tRNA synthetase [Dissophora globulifera]|uniref:arginine--tRNA ligase n=1 Tax=Dissophora globulifera TaxID=979702 RepID=A0A9P6RIP3_9FUNG|nr:Arginyl-tRNA synthetase [Dissophora globulifera]